MYLQLHGHDHATGNPCEVLPQPHKNGSNLLFAFTLNVFSSHVITNAEVFQGISFLNKTRQRLPLWCLNFELVKPKHRPVSSSILEIEPVEQLSALRAKDFVLMDDVATVIAMICLLFLLLWVLCFHNNIQLKYFCNCKYTIFCLNCKLFLRFLFLWLGHYRKGLF